MRSTGNAGHTENLRVYGAAPFRVVVVHGGPGALGSMAPVARALASEWGVLEPLLAALSIEGQLDEMRVSLARSADPPVTLIGSSWGAMLSFIFAARYPALVAKLLLVGSGPYEAKYAVGLDELRRSRLSEDQRRRLNVLLAELEDPSVQEKNAIFAQAGRIFASADTYDPLPGDTAEEDVDVRYDVFTHVWPEAADLRASGQLLALGQRIRCPVVAIHGEYDPHPGAGVREPLARVLSDFRFILLPRCGHEPWIERHARDEFYRLLRAELREEQAP